MREIPYNILLFSSQQKNMREDLFLTEIMCPRTTTRSVRERGRLRAELRNKTTGVEVVELRNSGFKLEFPNTEQLFVGNTRINWDRFPIIIHHPDLDEKNYSYFISVYKFWVAENIASTRNIEKGLFMGTYCFDSSGYPVLENSSEESLRIDREYGELIGNKKNYTKNYVVGNYYLILDGVSSVSRGIYLGVFDTVVDISRKTENMIRDPYTALSNYLSINFIKRVPCHVFRYVSERETLSSKEEFFDKYINFVYFREDRRKSVIDLGKFDKIPGVLEILQDKDEFFTHCLIDMYRAFPIVPEYFLKNNLDLMKNWINSDQYRISNKNSLRTSLESLKQVVDLTEEEIDKLLC